MKYPIRAVFFVLLAGACVALPTLNVVSIPLAWDRLWVDQISALSKRSPDARITLLQVRPQDLDSEALDSRLNWAVVLRSLEGFQPKFVGLLPRLSWKEPNPLTEGALRKRVDLMPRMALAAVMGSGESSKPVNPSHFESIPTTGESPIGDGIPSVEGILEASGDTFLRNGTLGFSKITGSEGDPASWIHGVRIPLLVQSKGALYPSLPLVMFLQEQGLTAKDIEVHLDEAQPHLQIRDLFIPTTPAGFLLLPHQSRAAFPKVEFASVALAASSFQEVAAELRKHTENLETLSDHSVLIALTSDTVDYPELLDEPISEGELMAMALATLQSGFFLRPWPSWANWAGLAGVSILGLVLLAAPRWMTALGALGVAVIFAGLHVLLFQRLLWWSSPWIALFSCALLLVLGLVLPRAKRT